MIPNSLLYLHDLQMKYVDAYRDLIRKLYSYINAIHMLSTSYLLINLIAPSHLNAVVTQVKKTMLKQILSMIQ